MPRQGFRLEGLDTLLPDLFGLKHCVLFYENATLILNHKHFARKHVVYA